MSEPLSKDGLLGLISSGAAMTRGQKLRLTVMLSVPAILAQMSTIVMQYIDTAMVGSLGEEASASISLMASSTWLFWGLAAVCCTGFSVQVAHRIGAADIKGAQSVLRQSIPVNILLSLLIGLTGVILAWPLPHWLGADNEVGHGATVYFAIFMGALPLLQIGFLSGQMLRCSGNTLFPGVASVAMCLLDILFNWLLIFPDHHFTAAGMHMVLPGADLGVAGAAIGTSLAELVVGVATIWYLFFRNKMLNLRGALRASWWPKWECIVKAARISAPLALERLLFCGAQVAITAIVAPLGRTAIAANGFAVTAESLCYMPGFGVSEAATALTGQSIGARRPKLCRSFANITVLCGVAVMTVMGAVMYITAPALMNFVTPVEAISDLGVEVLRIQAFAEPMFAAAIVCFGAMVGAGDAFIPACFNLGSIWGVRITLALILAPIYGLAGVWIAMAIELTFRGTIFLLRLRTSHWMHLSKLRTSTPS